VRVLCQTRRERSNTHTGVAYVAHVDECKHAMLHQRQLSTTRSVSTPPSTSRQHMLTHEATHTSSTPQRTCRATSTMLSVMNVSVAGKLFTRRYMHSAQHSPLPPYPNVCGAGVANSTGASTCVMPLVCRRSTSADIVPCVRGGGGGGRANDRAHATQYITAHHTASSSLFMRPASRASLSNTASCSFICARTLSSHTTPPMHTRPHHTILGAC
jgi:hypothetical protein